MAISPREVHVSIVLISNFTFPISSPSPIILHTLIPIPLPQYPPSSTPPLPIPIPQTKKKNPTHIIPHNHTIHKLQPPHHDQERHKHINELDALRRALEIIAP